MNVDEEMISGRCTDAVFERGQSYRREGRIQQIGRFDDLVTATIQGTNLYDVTVKLSGDAADTHCTCPYDGAGDCKHVVAALLDFAADPPPDESEKIEATLDDVSAEDLRSFVRDALATKPELRDQFLARFGDDHKSVEEYREEIGQLFEQRADPTVFIAIDFSRFFEIAEQYRDRGRYLTAATVYQALFEEVNENWNWIDGAYDHYAQTIQRALDNYGECILATDPNPDEFNTDTSVLEAQASKGPPINSDQFRRALEDLKDRYD